MTMKLSNHEILEARGLVKRLDEAEAKIHRSRISTVARRAAWNTLYET